MPVRSRKENFLNAEGLSVGSQFLKTSWVENDAVKYPSQSGVFRTETLDRPGHNRCTLPSSNSDRNTVV